jgi:tetratricopeptide (TPR) repeat protein
MPTLRVLSNSPSPSLYRVELALDGLDDRPRKASVEFALPLDDAEREQFRWYFEEYLQYPHDPAPAVAAGILERMTAFGGKIFRCLFDLNEEARVLWAEVEKNIAEFRFEIHAARDQSAVVPWELMQDPVNGVRPALAAKAFVRCTPQRSIVSSPKAGPVRVLLVISRPEGERDVPFRAVATRLTDSLDESFEIVALRPPTYKRFAEVLSAAATSGRPFHIVHFDGHGTFANLHATGRAVTPRNKRGYISFEDGAGRYVPGDKIGTLLARNGIPILVLNACQSARAEASSTPSEDLTGDTARAFLSFAHEASEAGVPGVVAMSHAIYVDTAAQFVAGLYVSLTLGHSLGEAVTLARRRLSSDSERHIWFESRVLQDWPVPVVYESRPLVCDTRQSGDSRIRTAPVLPERPKVGFWGRDASLLALDRAFDTSGLVLLHGYAGNGKTSTAAEFARWYERTGGVPPGHVLYTSFETYTPLRAALDQLADRFRAELDSDWLSLPDEAARRSAGLSLLRSRPFLWIWDNLEPVSGFPPGTASTWTPKEQNELRDFLCDAAGTPARILLASRRDESEWLRGLPHRVALAALDPVERFQLAAAVARGSQGTLGAASDWMPLLDFSGGNPMALTVLIRQALQQGLATRGDIENFVQRLREGEAEFADEKSEARSASLAASLQYGFQDAFKEDERKQLALLELFQGFVDVETLGLILVELGELPQDCTEGLPPLLNRAAAIGQLTAVMKGFYTIHPALPWFFRRLVQKYYAGRNEELIRAFLHAEARVGEGIHSHYELRDRGIVAHLRYEEANLIQAFRLATVRGLWEEAAGVLRPVAVLYEHLGRVIEWARLVQQIEPHFIDPASYGPRPGVKENDWALVLGYRVRLTRDSGQFEEAQKMQSLLAEHGWKRAGTIVDRGAVLAAGEKLEGAISEPSDLLLRRPEDLNSNEVGAVIDLAVQLNALAQIQRRLGLPECALAYKQASIIARQVGDWRIVSACCDNLIYAYTEIANIQDLDKAEFWATKSLALAPKVGPHWWAKAHAGVGRVWRRRFLKTLQGGTPELDPLLRAEQSLLQAEQWLLDYSTVEDQALVHSELGNVYTYLGKPDTALAHFQQALKYDDQAGKHRDAANLRFNVALMLGNGKQFKEAIQYALAALSGYERLGLGDTFQAGQTRQLLSYLRAGIAPQAV